MIKTGYFQSKGNKLYYNMACPKNNANNTGILFVHAADGNRLGPHRMYVEFANEFNNLGFPTFRFDLLGHGDSFGDNINNDVEKDLADLKNAISFFIKTAPIEKIILLGISRGAYLCFSSAAKYKLPLSGLILLSIPVSNKKTVSGTMQQTLTDYLKKAASYRSFRRLLEGKINFSGVSETIIKASQFKKRFPQVQSGKFISRCHAMMIYGQCDHVGECSSQYYSLLFEKNNIPYEVYNIENANHSFFHYQWKQQILDLCLRWLRKTQNNE